jgi:DNA topoisomerase-1
MQLLILESPNKVKDVQKYTSQLGQPYTVMATCGHILDLPPMNRGACINLKTFSADELVPRDASGEVRIAALRKAITHATKVVVATDPDREGEAIAAEVWPWIPAGKAFRATFEEITLRGVQDGLANIQSDLDRAAADAAAARRVIDRLAGWHATSTVFEKLRHLKGVSAGRLQSAALRLVVDRFREHQSFKPATTYGIRLKLRTEAGGEFSARLLEGEAPRVFGTLAEAQAFPRPSSAFISALDSKQKSQRPRPPFEATSWLQVAQKALHLSVKEASFVTQALFEQGHTTYPRTDTVRVSPDAIEWARAEIARRFGPKYLPESPVEHRERGKVQGAHEAIRPTIPHESAELSVRQTGPLAQAYALIEARFLASQAASRIVDETTAVVTAGGAKYEATGQVEIFDGWRRVLSTDAQEEPEKVDPNASKSEEEPEKLPSLTAGQQLTVVDLEIFPITTKPKSLFTQASLVAELKRLGIGRPSTYPAIVPLLLSRAWVSERATPAPDKKKRRAEAPAVLVPEPVAFELADFLATAFPSLVDYSFTAAMEEQLDQIAAQQMSRLAVASAWWSRFQHELEKARAIKPRVTARPDLGLCPKCEEQGTGGHLRLITGMKDNRRYEFAACDQDTKAKQVCGYTCPTEGGLLIPRTNCPTCGTSMRAIRRRDGGHSWLCSNCPQPKWFVADEKWNMVPVPSCSKCSKSMTHRERSNHKGDFFWACFGCEVFLDSDVFGGLPPAAKPRPTKEKSSRRDPCYATTPRRQA